MTLVRSSLLALSLWYLWPSLRLLFSFDNSRTVTGKDTMVLYNSWVARASQRASWAFFILMPCNAQRSASFSGQWNCLASSWVQIFLLFFTHRNEPTSLRELKSIPISNFTLWPRRSASPMKLMISSASRLQKGSAPKRLSLSRLNPCVASAILL